MGGKVADGVDHEDQEEETSDEEEDGGLGVREEAENMRR
jgi:hypothetical protein